MDHNFGRCPNPEEECGFNITGESAVSGPYPICELGELCAAPLRPDSDQFPVNVIGPQQGHLPGDHFVTIAEIKSMTGGN